MAKSKVTATAAFSPSIFGGGTVNVWYASIWSRSGDHETCGHHHASSTEAEACIPSMGKDDRGRFRATLTMTIKAIAQLRPYVEPAKTAPTRKRKQVTA